MNQLEETRKLLIKLRKEYPERDIKILFKEYYAQQIGGVPDEKEKEENMSSSRSKA